MRKNCLLSIGLVWILAWSVLQSGCGMLDPYLSSSTAPAGYTRVSFSQHKDEASLFNLKLFHHFSLVENAYAAGQLLGGLMLYVVGQAGTDFYGSYYLPDESVPFIKNFPNGTYRYFAYGFLTRPLGGTITVNTPIDVAKCAVLDIGQNAISLNGADINIGVSLSTQTCAARLGLGPAAPLNPVKVYSCSPTGMTFVSPAAAPNTACSTISPPYKGSILSYYVGLKQMEIYNGNPNPLVENGAKMISQCMPISFNYPPAQYYPFALPLGMQNIWGRNIPFPLTFKTFNTANCTPDPVGIYGIYDFQFSVFQTAPINIIQCSGGSCGTNIPDTQHKVVFVDQTSAPNEARIFLRDLP